MVVEQKELKKTVGLQLPPSLWEKFKKVCDKKKMKLGGAVEQIIVEWIKVNK